MFLSQDLWSPRCHPKIIITCHLSYVSHTGCPPKKLHLICKLELRQSHYFPTNRKKPNQYTVISLANKLLLENCPQTNWRKIKCEYYMVEQNIDKHVFSYKYLLLHIHIRQKREDSWSSIFIYTYTHTFKYLRVLIFQAQFHCDGNCQSSDLQNITSICLKK